MTAEQIYIRIQNDLNSSGANRNRRYLPEQIELAVNTEQLEYIQNAFPEEPGINFKPEQRYLDAVQGLISLSKLSNIDGIGFSIPQECLRLINISVLESCSAGFLDQLSKNPVRKLSTRRLINGFDTVVQNTAFYQDNNHEVSYTVKGNMVVFCDGSAIKVISIRAEYIRIPKQFSISKNQTLELSAGYHEEICDRVVQRLRERIGDPKFQSGQTHRNNTL